MGVHPYCEEDPDAAEAEAAAKAVVVETDGCGDYHE